MEGNTNEWDDIFGAAEEETQELEHESNGAEDEIGTTDGTGGDPNISKGRTAAGGYGSVGDPEDTEGEDDETEPDGEGTGTAGGLTAEMQAVIAAQSQQRVDDFYKKQFAGFISPYTQRPIETEADYHAYMQSFEAEEQQRQLQNMGVDQKMLNDIISNHPAVKQAQAVMMQQQKEQANTFMKQEFADLQREFPDAGLTDPRELFNTPEGRRCLDLWSSANVSLADAYAVAYRAQIREKDIAAVKQGVLNQQNSKNHLKQTKGGTAPKPVVTDELREEFRAFFGDDITDEEIEAKMKR